MHELAVTESLLEIALRHAPQEGSARITNLYLVIGQFASIIDDSVQFYWEIIAKDTIAEGAQLHFRRIPAEILCLACQQRYHPERDQLLCPNCGSTQLKILNGDEFFLEAIDVETVDPGCNSKNLSG